MTCKNEFQMNETAAQMMRSDEMMKEVSGAIWRLNEWADCTDGVPVDLGYIMSQPELALQNQPIFDVLESLRLAMRAEAAFIVPVEGGGDALVGFTSYEELEAGPPVSSIRVGVEQLLHMTLMNENCEGLVINPRGSGFYLPKDYIAIIFRADELLEDIGEK